MTSQPASLTLPTPATPYRATSSEDLLAMVPVVLGFEPADSIVMLTFGAGEPFHARADLPGDRSAMDEPAELLLAAASHHGVDRVVLIVYSEDPALARVAWRALEAATRRRRIAVIVTLRADGSRWYPMSGGGARLREIGVAYDLSTHPFTARAVLEGRVTHGSRESLAATVEADPEAVARCRAVVGSAARRTPVSVSEILTEGAWVEELVSRHLAERTTLGDADLARLLLVMASVRVRDAAWSCVPRPVAREGVAFWSDVVRRAPDDLLAPAGALLAWSAWQAGDGALAWCALDRVSAVDPEYSLAVLLGDCLRSAMNPSSMDGAIDWRLGLHEEA